MDYRKSAEEWMQYMLLAEERGRLILGKVSELARGELAVLRFLLQGSRRQGAEPAVSGQHLPHRGGSEQSGEKGVYPPGPLSG